MVIHCINETYFARYILKFWRFHREVRLIVFCGRWLPGLFETGVWDTLRM